MPSHQMSPSSVSAQLVKIVFSAIVAIAFGFVSLPVPGATPKKPYSGLIAQSRPSSPNFIQAMSSPIVSTFQPGKRRDQHREVRLAAGRRERAGQVLHARPPGEVSLRISMCSAIQPSSRAITEAMRSAKHFLPSSALPP